MFKAIFRIAVGAAALSRVFGANADVPDVANASVTIPYSELKELWKAAQQASSAPAKKPPVPGGLLSAHYEIELRDDRVVGFVEFEAQSFCDDWNVIPLIGNDLRVLTVEPADANVISRDGNYSLLTSKASKQRVKMQFVANLVQEGDGSRVQIPAAPALMSLLTVKDIPPNKTLRVAGASAISNDKGVASFRVTSGEAIDCRLVSNQTVKPQPSEWETSVQCATNFADDVLHYESQVTAIATGGSAQNLKVILPSSARVLSVKGEDLALWHPEDSGSSRAIALEWRTPGISSRRIELVYELPQAGEGEWKLEAPRNEKGKMTPPIFAVTAGAEIELTTAPEERSTPPRWLAERIACAPHTVVTRGAKLTAKLLPVVEVAPAVIETAQFNTRIVADGSLINEQVYIIRSASSTNWMVELPNDSELLSCAVDDRKVSPVNRGNGTLEIPIGSCDQGRSARVALAYTSKIARFQPVSGQLKIELPRTPLLINTLIWDLAIPAQYEVAALEGNLAPVGGAPNKEGSTVVRLKKELLPKRTAGYRAVLSETGGQKVRLEHIENFLAELLSKKRPPRKHRRRRNSSPRNGTSIILRKKIKS